MPRGCMRSWRTEGPMGGGEPGVVYIDTSAAVKLVRPEVHSAELSRWVDEAATGTFVSSVLIEVELIRATRRFDQGRLDRAVDVLAGIGIITLSSAVVERASRYRDPGLRSLDAIHLATAEHVAQATNGSLRAFLAFDERLLAAARNIGLPAAAPGLL